ncbi:MAG: hypothetical protein ACRDRL_00380 [Sciscionella sp.]
MRRSTKLSVGVVATILVIGGAGAGVAAADSATPTDSPAVSGTASAPSAVAGSTHHHHARRLLGRVEHGEVTLRGKKNTVVDIQRGQLASVTGSTITVHSKDGFSGSYTLAATTKITKITKQRAQSTASALHQGDRVRVIAHKAGNTATVVRLADAGPPKQQGSGSGH